MSHDKKIIINTTIYILAKQGCMINGDLNIQQLGSSGITYKIAHCYSITQKLHNCKRDGHREKLRGQKFSEISEIF